MRPAPLKGRKMKHIPNLLSALRILMVPAFVLTFFYGGEHAMYWAALIFFLAAVTDFLDGYIARRFDFVTNLGRILDPAGDKLMTLAMVTCLAVREVIPGWIPWFFLTKELLMTAGGFLLSGRVTKDMPSSNMIGKTATFFLFIVGVALLTLPVPPPTAHFLILAAVLLAFAAFVSYIIMFAGLVRKRKAR